MKSARNSDEARGTKDKKLVSGNLDQPWVSKFEKIQSHLSHGGVLSISGRDVIVFLIDFYESNKQNTNGQETNHVSGELVQAS